VGTCAGFCDVAPGVSYQSHCQRYWHGCVHGNYTDKIGNFGFDPPEFQRILPRQRDAKPNCVSDDHAAQQRNVVRRRLMAYFLRAIRRAEGRLIAICFAAAVACVSISAGPVSAEHIQPHQCGVKSSSYARICRPSAYVSCIRASAKGVKGYRAPFCARRQTACRSCLDKLRLCIRKIGHAKKSEFSCDECSGKFSRCIGKRYPKLKD
jgi:hypothetical protein